MWTGRLVRPAKRRKLSLPSTAGSFSHLDLPASPLCLQRSASPAPSSPVAAPAQYSTRTSTSNRSFQPPAAVKSGSSADAGSSRGSKAPLLDWKSRRALDYAWELGTARARIPTASAFGQRSLSTTAQLAAAPAPQHSSSAESAFAPTQEPPPLNEAQVPLIAPNLRNQLFPPHNSPFAPPPPTREAIEISLEHLRTNGLLADSLSKPKAPAPAVDFQLPALQGPTLSHHFHALGQDAAEPYLSLARSFAEAELPPMPEKERWVCMPGWTHYHSDGSWEAVNYPSEASQAMVFDVETLPYQGGHYPIMAVAVGNDGWYGWCSPWLTGDDSSPNHLIPFSRPPDSSSPSPSSPDDFRSTTSTLFERPQDVPRVFIGHNVLFDRARVASEYALRRPSTRFIDTLSLHVAVSGLTNPQRPGWLKYRKGIQLAEEDAAKEAAKAVKSGATKYKGSAKSTVKAVASPAVQTWKEVGSVNSLSEVARLHCGIKVDKSLRDILIDPSTTIEDVRHGFEEIMTYCALDVLTTLRVYRVLLPKFLSTCPHPASFAGAILMSQPVLPVDRRWPQYVERAEDTYQKRLLAVKDALQAIAEDARTEFEAQDENGRYAWEDDIWLRQLDWSLKKARRLPGVVPAKRRVVEAPKAVKVVKPKKRVERPALPRWVKPLDDPKAKISIQSPLAALLFRTTWRTYPLVFTHSHGCLFAVPSAELSSFKPLPKETLVDVEDLGRKDELIKSLDDVQLFTVPTSGAGRCRTILGRGSAPRIKDGLIASEFVEMAAGAAIGKDGEEGTKYRPIAKKLRQLADEALKLTPAERQESLWLRQLDWASDAPAAPVVEEVEDFEEEVPAPSPTSSTMNLMDIKQSDLYWPRWFWDLDVPGGGLDITVRKRAVPLLLKLRWRGFPIVYSKAHGWIYRVPNEELDAFLEADNSLRPLRFDHVADTDLHEDQHAASFFKMPHPDGEDKNVGDPLSKPFVAAFEDGLLTSDYAIAKDALALNASCSYWRSARERIVNQMVVWEGDAKVPTPTPAAIAAAEVDESTNGLILPQVIPMGTVTRRAVEKTWLTAANAKKNRVGSELKSMVVAPPGYAIVGADVDSEELWICSVMGDAQFGIHGASAIGWMTLEGTKSAGTDLHSKSASILGISRDDAKVFNYSRIYGAGVKHAVQLLTKSNPALSTEQATKLAKNLYASTKGIVDRTRAFDRNFWHGGTESLVFNKLEQIAQSDRPRTPALGCGLTAALTKCFLPAEGRSRAGEGFMPSRINWVVQSSGVDYLHLLLVAMEYLTKRFEIDARYMISVHDEIRYLVKEEDKYRAAMALQVANVWTRSLFALRLQMPDLPQGCAFFSAVDIDTCFRKEVNMTCITPSNPDAIPFGESLDINASLSATSHGSLFRDGRPMSHEANLPPLPPLPRPLTPYEIQGDQHRVDQTAFLVAQTTASPQKIKELWEKEKNSKSSNVLHLKRLGMSEPKKEVKRETAPVFRPAEQWNDDQGLAEAMAEYLATSPADYTFSRRRPDAARKEKEQSAAERKEREEEEENYGGFDVPQETLDELNMYTPLIRSQV